MYENKNEKPVFLKIAPDLTTIQLDEIVEIIIATKLTGVIATNTTIERSGLAESKELVDALGAGGLSGEPVLNKAVQVVKYLKEKSQNQFVIIGVGGIHDHASAKMHMDAGADLVQVYTGMIYEGPGIVKKIVGK